jgi:signal transduction histidine kinase
VTSASPLILNVDDDDAARYVKSRVLRLAGFDVIEAATGEMAQRLIAERSPALVLLDVRLPDMNGRELAAQIKAQPATAQIVVLQTSATHVDMRHRVASLEAGADSYLVEPIAPEELVANVRALLRMRQAEAERQKALEALREADRRKDEFLAMLAHELRNPLAPIRNAVEVLQISQDRAVQDRARELIRRQVGHLARLVDDLLDVSRITQRKVVLQRKVVSLHSLVASAVEVARPLIDAQGHELAVSLPAAEVWLDVDPVRISQVIGNLLNNAAKFTPRAGRIALDVAVGPGRIEISVTDNGVGIGREVLASVFELFAQADRSLERSQGGLGIGLSLVKGLVEMHGGKVFAHSDGPGHGSRFTLHIPRGNVAAPGVPAGRPASRAAHRSRRVMVVEDNLDSAEAMMLMLRAMGHQVTLANDGREALDMARREVPDVILLDIGLPGLDGYQLARRLRGMPETRAARLIAVSGYGQDSDRERSAAAGFDLHLVKPVDPAALADAIDADARDAAAAPRLNPGDGTDSARPAAAS